MTDLTNNTLTLLPTTSAQSTQQMLVDTFYDGALESVNRLSAYHQLKEWPPLFEDVTLRALWGYMGASPNTRWSTEIRRCVWEECQKEGWSRAFLRRIGDVLTYEDGVLKDDIHYEVLDFIRCLV
jgi:hypothetical protein